MEGTLWVRIVLGFSLRWWNWDLRWHGFSNVIRPGYPGGKTRDWAQSGRISRGVLSTGSLYWLFLAWSLLVLLNLAVNGAFSGSPLIFTLMRSKCFLHLKEINHFLLIHKKMIAKLCQKTRTKTQFGSVRLQPLLIFTSPNLILYCTHPPWNHQSYSRIISALVSKTEGIFHLSVSGEMRMFSISLTQWLLSFSYNTPLTLHL